MKKIISLMLCIILTFSCIISVGAYSFSNNGIATKKATAYRLPSANSGDVWWIDKNDKLQVFCKDGDYYLVLYPFNNTGKHVLGFVSTSAVKVSGVPNASGFYKNETIRTKANANLYHNPSTDKLTGASGSNQTVRATVSKGQELTVLFEKDGFYCVRTSNDTGFIEKSKICNHSSVSNKEISSTAININDKTYHEVKIGYNEVCDDCGLVTKKNASKSEKEKHSLSGNICTDCGWSAPVTEKEECKHSNTTKHMSEEKETIYTQKDDTHHSVTTYYHLYCTDCYTYTEKNLSEKYNEEHNVSGDKCIICGFTKDSGKTAWVCNTNGTTLKIHRVAALGITIRGEIPDGTKFTVFGEETNGFYRVEYNGTVGYVQAEYVTFTEPKKESVENVKKTAYVYNTSGKLLNIRSEADKASSVVMTMAEGSSVTVTGDIINGFYPVECEGKSGYAMTEYITLKKQTTGKEAWIYNSSGENVDIHRLPAFGKTTRGEIPANKKITVFGDKTNGFYRVEYNGISGYTQAKYITFSKPPEGKTAWVYNSVEPLKIHRSAALGKTTRGEIPIGDVFIVTGERTNGFYPVYYNGISGFAESKYVTYDKSKALGTIIVNDKTNKIKEKMTSMMNGTILKGGYKVGGRYTGAGECKGFAQSVFKQLFGGGIQSTKPNDYGYEVNYDSKKVVHLGTLKNPTEAQVKALLMRARPGDFIQMNTSMGSPHSAIVYEVTLQDITAYEANMDWENGISKNLHKWNYYKNLHAISLYTAKGY